MNVQIDSALLRALVYGKIPVPPDSTAVAVVHHTKCKVISDEMALLLAEAPEFVVDRRSDCVLLWEKQAYDEEYETELTVAAKLARQARIREEMSVTEHTEKWLYNIMQHPAYKTKGSPWWRAKFDALLVLGGINRLRELLITLGQMEGNDNYFL